MLIQLCSTGLWSNKGSHILVAASILAMAGLSGCGGSTITQKLGRMLPDPTPYIYGVVVADEPSAVVAAGQHVLGGDDR